MTTLVFDQQRLRELLNDTPLAPWGESLSDAMHKQQSHLKHGHLERWQSAVAGLPTRSVPCPYSVTEGAIDIHCSIKESELTTLKTSLESLRPWRKGPFRFDALSIDCEWRSDWKWDRLINHIEPLHGRKILDVGCGNGYYCWRMLAAGASCVLGIDPSLQYLMQFNAAQHFIQQHKVQFLPLPMEALPHQMQAFDSIFSMGVLYHRRDPLSHLTQLRQAMRIDGQLILETLVIPGQNDESVLIEDRYANMRNVYELPTVARLQQWLGAGGFCQSQLISVAHTSVEEQRSTPWMTSHSLKEALDPDDSAKTVEGYPRPLRAIVTARLS